MPRLNPRWTSAWAVLSLLGALLLGGIEMLRQEEAFYVDGRIAHRLLSQRAVQHDAVLAMLALLPPEAATEVAQRGLHGIFPQIVRVVRRGPGEPWPAGAEPTLAAAAEASRRAGHPVTAAGDFAGGRVWLVLAAPAADHALQLDLGVPVDSPEWPASLGGGSTDVRLAFAGREFALEQRPLPAGLRRFGFAKSLATPSQPYELRIVRSFSAADLPWPAMLLWAALVAAGLAAAARYRAQARARRRAEELLRLGQATRLNALGELAAGLAHELNQPLTAVMASTQAAGRLLDDDPPELDTARAAMAQAVAQARRAAEVLGRLRKTVEPTAGASAATAVPLLATVRSLLDLLEPEWRGRAVTLAVDGDAAVRVRADPVALEQILHNLVMNALQALERVPAAQRRLRIAVAGGAGAATLTVADSGPGIPAEALPRLFEPFFTTREGGLGLGLSLAETLAASLGGRLEAANGEAGGAVFTLTLPTEPGA